MKKIIFILIVVFVSYKFFGEEDIPIEQVEDFGNDIQALERKTEEFKKKALITPQIKQEESIEVEPAIKKVKSDKREDPAVDINTIFESPNYYNSFLEAFNSGRYEKVKEYAKNLLKIPDHYSSKYWYGDVCHGVYITLGKTYLAENNRELAIKYLIDSVKNDCIEKSVDKKYSPKLSSFGPERSLAFELYERGERESLVKFFEYSRSFWDVGVSDGIIDKAIKNIQTTELSYDQEDDPNFPFEPVGYIVKPRKAL